MIDNFFKLLGIPSSQLITCANQTLYMVFVSLVLGSLIGIIFAFTLVLTAKGGLKENKFVFNTLSFVINTVRSIPFIILLVFILPVTKAIVGTRIGTTAALVPLTFFIALERYSSTVIYYRCHISSSIYINSNFFTIVPHN